ncbi:Mobile element protein [Yersinia enterocolitica IP 10393]|nr:Mobile element protein [Yersinia enterocolitica IP 10393]
MERSFADAKQHHGHRYARFRGLMKVQMQCLLAAAAQNIKKMALLVLFYCLLTEYYVHGRAIKWLKIFRALLKGLNEWPGKISRSRPSAAKQTEPHKKVGFVSSLGELCSLPFTFSCLYPASRRHPTAHYCRDGAGSPAYCSKISYDQGGVTL